MARPHARSGDSPPLLERFRWPLFVVCAGFVLALHLRLAHRQPMLQRGPAVKVSARPHGAVVTVEGDAHAPTLYWTLAITYDETAPSETEVVLPLGIGNIDHVGVMDADGAHIAARAEAYRDYARVSFALPAADASGARKATLEFWAGAPATTFGWGYRAVASPWIAQLLPPHVPLTLQVVAPQYTTAPGWSCAQTTQHGRLCVTQLRGRRTVALPVEPYDDVLLRLLFATAIGTMISLTMYAIWRRWTVLAAAMGASDAQMQGGADTVDEYLADYRKLRATRRSSAPTGDEDEIEPLEAVALIARGVTAVLGLVASVFLVSFFEGGLFPVPAPLALAIWGVVAGATIVLGIGFRTPRPWIAICVGIALGAVALVPQLRWIAPGIPPLGAALLMQLTVSDRRR